MGLHIVRWIAIYCKVDVVAKAVLFTTNTVLLEPVLEVRIEKWNADLWAVYSYDRNFPFEPG